LEVAEEKGDDDGSDEKENNDEEDEKRKLLFFLILSDSPSFRETKTIRPFTNQKHVKSSQFEPAGGSFYGTIWVGSL